MARAKKVIIEAANPSLRLNDINKPSRRIRVCAYARVSTDDVDQKNSYKAQVEYYTKKIMDHEEWDFVDVYTDEGITGTNTLKRTGFNKMIKMCKEGKIDIILTKSVSRFARNTVDTLKTCRDLKRKNVGVIFESDHINTLKDDIEMPLTMASSRAQEESRSISDNVKWGFKRKFENGGFMLVTSRFLGYDRDEHGELIINEAEAEIVRKIFDLFIEGYTYQQIATFLGEANIKTITGKEEWSLSVISNIISNEKYVGNLISQKTYTTDFLTHERVKNQGEVPKYIIEGHHEAIISMDKFLKAQERAAKIRDNWLQKRGKKVSTSKYALSNLMFCGKCNSPMRRKTWRARNGKLTLKYGCKSRLQTRPMTCRSGYIKESDIQIGLVNALNRFFSKSDIVVENTIDSQFMKKISMIDIKINGLKKEMTDIINPKSNSDDSSTNRLVEIASNLKELEYKKTELIEENKKIILNKQQVEKPLNNYINEYNEELIRRYVERIIIKDEEHIDVVFKGGFIVEQNI